MLRIMDIHVHYGPQVKALRGVSLHVEEHEVVSIIGSNGAGKTTTLRAISGFVHPLSGSITFRGREIHQLPVHKIVDLGISYVPEDRKLFPDQTVRDNLLLGAYRRIFKSGSKKIHSEIEDLFTRFPVIGRRSHLPAAALSGGEQQMLVIARALMSKPSLLCLDEPSLGLAPTLITEIFDVIYRLKQENMTILLVEQLAYKSLRISDRSYVLETGRVLLEGPSASLIKDERVQKAYLGKYVQRT